MDPKQMNQQDDQVIQQPVQPSQDDTAVQQQVAPSPTPAGPTSKEQEALPSKPMTEYATEKEPVIPSEVAEMGVEDSSERIRIPQEAAKAGLEPAKEAVSIPANPTQIKWPMTPQKAQQIIKAPHRVIKDSVVWLATLIGKVVKKQDQKPAVEGGIV